MLQDPKQKAVGLLNQQTLKIVRKKHLFLQKPSLLTTSLGFWLTIQIADRLSFFWPVALVKTFETVFFFEIPGCLLQKLPVFRKASATNQRYLAYPENTRLSGMKTQRSVKKTIELS